MKVIRKPDGQLRYCYSAGPDIQCEFSLLSEVGEPYKLDAMNCLDEWRRSGYFIKRGIALEAPPWVSDFAVKSE